MKKTALVLLALILMVSMAACSGNSDSATGSVAVPSIGAPSIDVPAAGLTDEVTIILPPYVFELMQDDPAGAAQLYVDGLSAAEGVISAAVNEDHSVTIVATVAFQQLMMEELKASIDQNIALVLENKDLAPSITDITYNAGITEFTVEVDSAIYTGNTFEMMSIMGAALGALYYRAFAGDIDPVITVNFVDNAGGEVLDTVFYPDQA